MVAAGLGILAVVVMACALAALFVIAMFVWFFVITRWASLATTLIASSIILLQVGWSVFRGRSAGFRPRKPARAGSPPFGAKGVSEE